MNINEIKNTMKKYDFLMTNPHLGKNIILLGLGGSYAMVIDNEINNDKNELLKMTDFIFKSKYKEDVL